MATDGLFAFDDEASAALAAAHGTPLFAYSGAIVRATYAELRNALPLRVRIAYAVKANPHPAILAALAPLGASFDCASIGELDRVAALGAIKGSVFFAGPGKRTVELERAFRMGVRVQAEGFEDLERLDAIARREGVKEVGVNLRIHPRSGIAEANRIIGGTGPSAFGVDEEDVDRVLLDAKRLGAVRIRGIHVFAASNEREQARLAATHAMVFELARRVEDRLGTPLEQIDVGGGLGVPYAPSETPLDLRAFGRSFEKLLLDNAWFQGEAIVEPGRFLAARCGVYLARVVREKSSRGARFVILEGGVNHLLRPHLTGQPFPVRAVGIDGPRTPAILAGPLCTSLDRLGTVDLPPLRPGDLLAFGTAGAYGFTEGMTHFLSHPVPPEVFVE